MKKKLKTIKPTRVENDCIERGIAHDGDNPEWTEEDFKRARPAKEMLPQILDKENAEVLFQRGRGRPPKSNPKDRITIRLDADVLAWIKEQGPGYQTRINSILREAMERG